MCHSGFLDLSQISSEIAASLPQLCHLDPLQYMHVLDPQHNSLAELPLFGSELRESQAGVGVREGFVIVSEMAVSALQSHSRGNTSNVDCF